MYPILDRTEVWRMLKHIVSKDAVDPNFEKNIEIYQNEFEEVFDRLVFEHSNVKNKYYRDKNKNGIVNPLFSDHLSRLLYYFSRSLYLKGTDPYLLDQIFFSLRSQNLIDMFYEFDLNEFFFPAHAYATVLGRAKYGKYFVICQHCTVGNNEGIYPTFGDGVIVGPGAIILGNCNIGNNVQFAAGSLVVDANIPDNSIVFGRVPNLVLKENKKSNIDLRFEA